MTPRRIISAADRAALRYLSSTPREPRVAPDVFRNTSSETRSPMRPRPRPPWACVWALTRPGISSLSVASTRLASSGADRPGDPIAAIAPSMTSMSRAGARPVAGSRTRPPRMTSGRPISGVSARIHGPRGSLRARSTISATGPPPSGPWCSAPPDTKISACPTNAARAPATNARAWRVAAMSLSSFIVWR